MDWIFGSKVALLEDLVRFFELGGTVEKGVREFPWSRVKKGEARRILVYLRSNENNDTAANLLRYAILASDNDRTTITFLFTAIKYPGIQITEKIGYFEQLEMALARLQAEAVNQPDNFEELLKIRRAVGQYFRLRGDFEFENGSKRRAVEAFYKEALAIHKLLEDQPMVDYFTEKIGQAEIDLGQLEKETLPNLEKTISDLLAERNKLFAEINQRDQELIQLDANIRQRQGVLEEIQNMVRQNQQQLDLLCANQQQELSVLENQKAGVEKSVRILKKKFSEFRTKSTQESQKCLALQIEVHNLEAQRNEMINQIESLHVQQTGGFDQEANLEITFERENLAQLEASVQSLNLQVNELEAKKRDLLEEIETLQVSVEGIRAERSDLDRDLAQLSTKRNASQKKVKQIEQELLTVEEQLNQKREEFQKTVGELDKIPEQIRDYESTISTLQAQNSALQSQLNEIHKPPATAPKNGNRKPKANVVDTGLPDWLN